MVDLGIVEGIKSALQTLLDGAVQLATDIIVGIAKAIGPALVDIALGVKDAFGEAFKENPVEMWFLFSSIIIIVFVGLYAWRTVGRPTGAVEIVGVTAA